MSERINRSHSTRSLSVRVRLMGASWSLNGSADTIGVLSAEGVMVRWIVSACSIALVAALSIGASQAAKVASKKAEKVEYLRAAGSEPAPAPVKQGKKTRKTAQ